VNPLRIADFGLRIDRWPIVLVLVIDIVIVIDPIIYTQRRRGRREIRSADVLVRTI
jgi:hypothetical protein